MNKQELVLTNEQRIDLVRQLSKGVPEEVDNEAARVLKLLKLSHNCNVRICLEPSEV